MAKLQDWHLYLKNVEVCTYVCTYVFPACVLRRLYTHAFMYMSSILVAVVGFVQSNYTFREDSGGVQVCVHLREGHLDTELAMQVHTHRGTAQG